MKLARSIQHAFYMRYVSGLARYNEVAVVVAPRAGPRREHRGQIILGPVQTNNLAPLQTDIL